MIRIEDIMAQPGQLVPPKLKELERKLQAASTVKTSGNIRSRWGPQGKTIIADVPRSSNALPFRVGLGGDGIVVAPGTVNARMPRLNGKLLDEQSNGQAPSLNMRELQPGDSLRSWMVAYVRLDGTEIEKTEDALFIKHVQTLDQPESLAELHIPLAQLKWRDRTSIERIHQIVRRDLRVYLPATGRALHVGV